MYLFILLDSVVKVRITIIGLIIQFKFKCNFELKFLWQKKSQQTIKLNI